MSEVLLGYEPAVHLVALVFYGAASAAALVGTALRRPRLDRWGTLLGATGLAIHGTGLLMRWIGAGHGPYLTRYEALSSDAWFAVAIVMIATWRMGASSLSRVRAAVLSIAMLLLGVGLYSGTEVRALPPTFAGVWLTLHVGFYFLAFGTALVALVWAGEVLRGRADASEADQACHRFAGLAFAFWGIGMLTGSVWAYYSWGRFWGWDPVESWSLVTWLLFGLYLHLRRFHGWRGVRAAWLYAVCFALAMVSLFGTSLVMRSLHSAYFS